MLKSLSPPHPWAGDAVIDVMKEGNQDVFFVQQVLELLIERLTCVRVGLLTGRFRKLVTSARRVVALKEAALAMEQGKGKGIRIIVIADPAADLKINVGAALDPSDIIIHGRRLIADLYAECRPLLQQATSQGAVAVLK